ncbi:hypothetical protein CSC42_0006 [Pseudomonas aeruginosa]|nr:hypothetical protein CSC42_0006 [Pseudomonas aeruginosa]
MREVGPGEILIVRAGPFTPGGAGLRVGVEACDLGLDLAAELPASWAYPPGSLWCYPSWDDFSQKEPGHDGLDCWCYGGIKAATDITQSMLTLKTDAAVTTKVVELNGVLLGLHPS